MTCCSDTQPPELVDRYREQNEAFVMNEEIVRALLLHKDLHTSMGPHGIHLSLPRELAESLPKLLSIIDQQSWLSGEGPVDWWLTNIMYVYKGWKELPGNYWPVSLTSDEEVHEADYLEYHHATLTRLTLTRWSGPVSRALSNSGSTWHIWTPSMTRWCTQRMT